MRYLSAPPITIDTTHSYRVILETSKGNIELDLFPNYAPVTVNNFIFLVQEGFYDDTVFHRVEENGYVQGGTRPQMQGPGYQIDDEIDNNPLQHGRGALAMVNIQPNTNGSQFMIAWGPQPQMNGKQTVFGKVHGSLEMVNLIRQGDKIIRASLVLDSCFQQKELFDDLSQSSSPDSLAENLKGNRAIAGSRPDYFIPEQPRKGIQPESLRQIMPTENAPSHPASRQNALAYASQKKKTRIGIGRGKKKKNFLQELWSWRHVFLVLLMILFIILMETKPSLFTPQRNKESALFKPLISEFDPFLKSCENKAGDISIHEKAVVWGLGTDALREAHFLLADERRGTSDDERFTLFMVTSISNSYVGRYTFSRAYQQTAWLCMIHYPEMEVVGSVIIQGNLPPEERPLGFFNEYGNLDGPIKTWIETLAVQ